jgi:hypothetical protein
MELLNLLLFFFYSDNLEHAFDLMKNIEPTQTMEYILKGVVYTTYGQQHHSVY